MPKKTNKDTTINSEKIIQIALDKEQRACLLDAIVCAKPRNKCLLPIIDQLEKQVRQEDPEKYETICCKLFLVYS